MHAAVKILEYVCVFCYTVFSSNNVLWNGIERSSEHLAILDRRRHLLQDVSKRFDVSCFVLNIRGITIGIYSKDGQQQYLFHGQCVCSATFPYPYTHISNMEISKILIQHLCVLSRHDFIARCST